MLSIIGLITIVIIVALLISGKVSPDCRSGVSTDRGGICCRLQLRANW